MKPFSSSRKLFVCPHHNDITLFFGAITRTKPQQNHSGNEIIIESSPVKECSKCKNSGKAKYTYYQSECDEI